jgi:type I restriction enzyme S subunit
MTPLGELGDWSGGNTPSKANLAYWDNGTVPWVSPKDMKVDEIASSEDRVTDEALSDGKVAMVPAGAVLFVTRSGILAHTLPVAVTKLPVTINQDLKALSPRAGVSPKYVAHAVRGASQRILKDCSKHGTTVASIDTKALLDFEIPMVALDRQQEIVAEIEKQFSRLDEAVANLQRVKANLKRYRSGVLEEFFGDEPNARIGDAIEGGPQNGLYLPRSAYGTGSPILRIDDYQTDWIRPACELRRVAASEAQVAVWALRNGDLVINRVNSISHLGKCVSVPESLAGALFESNMMRLCLRSTVVPRYVELYLGSALGRARLTQQAKWAVNQASINQQDVMATPIPLPDIGMQRVVVAEVDRRLSIVREVEAEVNANLKRARALRQAVLSKAFAPTVAVPPQVAASPEHIGLGT